MPNVHVILLILHVFLLLFPTTTAAVDDDNNNMMMMKQPSTCLDCPDGLQCNDYECELRHLDEIEQQQQQQQQQQDDAEANNNEIIETTATTTTCRRPNPKLIVTASCDMGRSGSTWVYNAVRLLYRTSAEQVSYCDSYWIRNLTKDKLQNRMNKAAAESSGGATSAVVLVKTHEQNNMINIDSFEKDIVPMLSHVVVSVRNGFRQDPTWMKYATHVVQYEDIVNDTIHVLRELANHLNILPDLSDNDLRGVDYQLMTLPIPGNQSTKFWSFHSRRGGRSIPPKPVTLTKQQEQREGKKTTHDHNDVLVTRHGARIDNGPDRDRHWLKKAGHGRSSDSHLSPLGYKAAKELAAEIVRLKDENITQVQHIISSPFIRCIETADAVARVLNLKIKIEPGIAEVGSSSSQMSSQQELVEIFGSSRIDQKYVPIMEQSELPGNSDGEYGDNAAARRAARVGKSVRQRYKNQGTILIVGHGASCLGLVSAFNGGHEYIGYCSLSIFRMIDEQQGGGGEWKLHGKLGDVSFLSDQSTALDSAW